MSTLQRDDGTEINSSDTLNLAFESIDSAFGYVDYIIAQVQVLITHFQAGDLNAANAHFVEVAELMDLYIQLMARIYQVVRANIPDRPLKDESIQWLEIHLLSVMKALLSAKENNDNIMLCDLLEYELVDNLTQWKIKILPELKKLKNV
jgi:hypothetical protein